MLQVSQQLTALSLPSRRIETPRDTPNVDAQVTSLGIAEQGTLNVLSVEAEDTLPANAGVREMPEGVSQYDELGALPILSKCSQL